MALTPLPVTVLPPSYGAAGVIFTWHAGDASAHNSFTSSGREILMVFNSDSGPGAPHAHTIKSSPDVPEGRVADITETIAVGQYRVYQMFPSGGWAVGGEIEVDPSDATLEYVVLRVP